jgi:competence protein ComEA
MRELVRRARARIQCFIENNAWVPLAGKAFGIVGALLVLAAIGAGHFDRTFDLGPARAEAASARRPPKVVASANVAAAPGSVAPVVVVGSASAAAKSPPAPKMIVLNEATAAELDALPGVGPAKAQAILALRTKLGGRFKRFEDLLRVRGIKRRALLKIREHAVLDAPPLDAPPTVPSASPSTPPSGGPRSAAALARP